MLEYYRNNMVCLRNKKTWPLGMHSWQIKNTYSAKVVFSRPLDGQNTCCFRRSLIISLDRKRHLNRAMAGVN